MIRLCSQAKQLGISRGSLYYLPRPASPADLAIMRQIDALHLPYPFAGSRTRLRASYSSCHGRAAQAE